MLASPIHGGICLWLRQKFQASKTSGRITGVGARQTGAVNPTAGFQREGELAVLSGKELILSSLSSRVSLDFNGSLTPTHTDRVGNLFLLLSDSPPGLIRTIKES